MGLALGRSGETLRREVAPGCKAETLLEVLMFCGGAWFKVLRGGEIMHARINRNYSFSALIPLLMSSTVG